MHTWYKKLSTIFISGLLVCGFILVPISQTLILQKAEALTVWDPGNYVANYGTMVKSAIGAAASNLISQATDSLVIKETILDGIAWSVINMTIKAMIRSTTQWVRSGFNGSPAFVQDLGGFMTKIADQVAGDFIYGAGLGMLCSPFKLNIQLALNIQYNQTKSYRAKCTLSGVVKNMEDFMNGNFLAGGWNGWYHMTMNPQNNPYGAMLEAQSALAIRMSNAQGQEMKLLDFGKGFLSVKDPNCTGNEGPCNVVTPGTAVESMLNSSLDLPNKRIAVADEINELLGALFTQLAGQVLGGVGGLLGLDTSSSGGQSYFDRMANEHATLGHANTSNMPIERSIGIETRYLGFQTQIIALIQDASTYKDRRYPNESCSGALTTSLSNQLTSAQQRATSTRITIDILRVLQSDYAQLSSATTSPTIIQNLLTKYSVRTVPEAQTRVMDHYTTLGNSGSLHSSTDLVTLELQTIPGLRDEISAFTQSIDNACRRYD